MKLLSETRFAALIEGGTLLESDRRGPKVYSTPAGTIVKLFRRKRLLSSSLWSPPAVRFARNAHMLDEAGLVSPLILEVAKVPHLARQVVVYQKIPGVPLRAVLQDASAAAAGDCIRRAGSFVDEVQSRGVFFRSFHFGNVLVRPNGGFALIDVLDARVKRRPLGLRLRQRNLRHLTRYEEDRVALFRHWDEFRDGYLAAARAGKSVLAACDLDEILADHRRSFPAHLNPASD